MGSLFVSGFRGGEHNDAVGAVGGDFHDFGGDVGSAGEVDEFLGAELQAAVAFGSAAVDGDDAHAHGARVLHAEVAETWEVLVLNSGGERNGGGLTSPSTGDDDPLPGFDCTALARDVCRDTTAHDRARFFVFDTIRKSCGVVCV